MLRRGNGNPHGFKFEYLWTFHLLMTQFQEVYNFTGLLTDSIWSTSLFHHQLNRHNQGSGLASVFSPRLIIFQKDWNNLSSISPLTDHFRKFPILCLLVTDIFSPGTETFKNISVLWLEILFPQAWTLHNYLFSFFPSFFFSFSHC